MQVDAVLFDLFNTLILLEKDEVFYTPCLRKLHEFLAKHGIDVAFNDFERVYFDVREKLYAKTEESFQEPHFNVRISQTLQRFGYNFEASDPVVTGATDAFSDELTRYVRLDEEACEVLQKLHGKYKLGIISNFAIPECVWRMVERFNLTRFFDVILISGAINKRKPSPEIFERALETLNVNASDSVFVGDMPGLDIKGAKNAGIKAILLERTPLERIVDVKPDERIRSLIELLDVLEDC